MHFAWNTTSGLMAATACIAVALALSLASESEAPNRPLVMIVFGASTAGVAVGYLARRAFWAPLAPRRAGPASARQGAGPVTASLNP